MAFIPTQAHTLMAKVKADTVSGVATCLLQIPSNGRIVQGGIGWFTTQHPDDRIEVYLVDAQDNILGSYTDLDVPEANRGFWFEPSGIVYIKPVANIGEAPGGLYMKIVATKGDLSADTFRANIKWGERL